MNGNPFTNAPPPNPSPHDAKADEFPDFSTANCFSAENMSEHCSTSRGLTGLPYELLAEICSYLCAHCVCKHTTNIWPFDADAQWQGDGRPASRFERTGSASLLNLSRVCRTLRAIAEPFLYHFPCTSRHPDLWILVNTLSNRPDLALKVSAVAIAYPTLSPSTSAPESRRSFPPSFLDAVKERIREAGSIPRDGLLGVQEDGEDSPVGIIHNLGGLVEHTALVSMLLQLVPNAEAARFCLPYEPFCALAADIISRAPPLASLRKLAFSSISNDRFLLVDQATPIMRLAQNLEALHFDRCGAVTNLFSASLGRNSPADPPPLSKLTELSLADSQLSVASLAALLNSVGPRLSKFKIRRSSPTLSFGDVLAVLQPWKGTLRELTILNSHEAPSEPIGSVAGILLLREFYALETLCVEAADLEFLEYLSRQPGVSSLFPPSLRDFRLRGDPRRVAAIMRDPLVAFNATKY